MKSSNKCCPKTMKIKAGKILGNRDYHYYQVLTHITMSKYSIDFWIATPSSRMSKFV